MPDLVVLKNGLPLSERFRWDPTQGVYLLGAHHDIHCHLCLETVVEATVGSAFVRELPPIRRAVRDHSFRKEEKGKDQR